MKLLLAFAFFLTACTQQATDKMVVTIGFNPAENADAVETNGKAFAEYFKKKTGYEVKTFVANDYTGLIESMKSGRVDFAFLPAFSYVKAEDIADAKVLMKAVRGGRDVLYSVIFVRTDKGYGKIEDLKGKNIAWVDPSSSSGFIVPKAALIAKKGIDPEKFFHKQIFAGGHDTVVFSVLNGQVDAGATFSNDAEGKDTAWAQFLKTDAERRKLKMIFVSDPIPSDTMATTGKFLAAHKDIVDKTVQMLAQMHNDPEGRQIMMTLYHIDSMVPATAAEYQPLREAAKLSDIQ